MPPAGHPGFRVLPAPPRVSDELLERFRGLASSNVADAMGRFGFMDAGMQSRSGLALCGLAVTVQCRPADNLMVHKALQVAKPGDIVVVSTCGNSTSAVFGELMCHTATAAKLGGIIVDGAIRDVEGIKRLAFPAYSRAVCPGSCDKDGPGEINVPISCGGTVVAPGDIIVGDADGIAVVPRESAAEVLTRVVQLMDRETKRVSEIDAGQIFKAEIDETLRSKGVIE
jgi:regulator of RNase E activity RraA